MPPPPDIEPLLALVDDAYRQADEDRALTERAFEVTSQDLEERSERLRAFFDNVPFWMGTAQVTESDVVIVSGNTAANQALGITRRAPTPLAATPLPGDVHDLWRERADAALESSSPVRFEYQLHASTEGRSYRATLTRVKSATRDRLLCYVVEDVTEHRRLFEQLVERDRRASVGTLAAGVAHEINNPLTYVLSNLVVAIEELNEIAGPGGAQSGQVLAPVIDALRDAANGAARVRAIVRDLKTFAASDAQALRAVDLVAAIRFAAKMAGAAMSKRARFTLELQGTPAVVGDETRLGQVFLNLLLNASEAIPPGNVNGNEIRVTVSIEDGVPVVDVSDTGRGIPEEVVGRIFDPFFTTRAGEGGTGLGLAVCAGILRDVGGEIRLHRTAPDRGTVFRLKLRPAVMTEEPGPSSLPPPLRRGRLLVIDDDVQVGHAMRRALSREHEVLFAIGVRAALDVLARDRAFDVILCDLRMPAGGGVAVFRALQATAPEMARRVMIVTGDPTSPQLEEIRAELVLPVVEKPFDPKALRALVREYLFTR